jgi:hypothetical protein
VVSQTTGAKIALLLGEAQTRTGRPHGLNIGSGRKPVLLPRARARAKSQVTRVKARARAREKIPTKEKIKPRQLLTLR